MLLIGLTGNIASGKSTVAQLFFGTPYLWGGKTSLGIDCSGLVQVALNASGLAAPRDFGIPNCGVNWVEISARGWDVQCWADIAHLADTRADILRLILGIIIVVSSLQLALRPETVMLAMGLLLGAFWTVVFQRGWSLAFDDPHLPMSMSFSHQAMQLVGMLLMPQLSFVFLLLLFLVFISLAMRVSRRAR